MSQTAGSPQDTPREPVSMRVLRVIAGWWDQLNSFGQWLNNPPHMPGVWSRIGVLSGIFVLAVLTTVTACILMYWASSAVQYNQCLRTAIDSSICTFFAY